MGLWLVQSLLSIVPQKFTELIGVTQGQMTVLRLTELLERGERLPRPDRCPCEVRPRMAAPLTLTTW